MFNTKPCIVYVLFFCQFAIVTLTRSVLRLPTEANYEVDFITLLIYNIREGFNACVQIINWFC